MSGQTQDTIILHAQTTILFDTDKWEIQPQFQVQLDSLIPQILTLNEPSLIIRAHTDEVGSYEYNVQLSRKRALSIKTYLYSNGLDTIRIDLEYFGESDQIANNQTSDGRALNRRATLLVQYQKQIEPIVDRIILKGKTIDILDQIGVLSDIIVNGRDFQDTLQTNADGKFEIAIPKDVILKFRAFADGYLPFQKMLKTEPSVFDTPLLLELSKPKPKRGNTISGKVVDDSTKSGIPARIVVRGKSFRDSTSSDQGGYFEIEVPKNAILAIDVLSDDYFFGTRMIKSGTQLDKDLRFELSKIEIGKNFIMEILFVGNSPQVLPESVPLLKNLLEVVRNSREYCFKIEGHVNVPRSPRLKRDSWSFKLSERRAEAIFKFLVSNGIGINQLGHEGFGNWFMVYPNAILESQQRLNRRVEVRIVKCE